MPDLTQADIDYLKSQGIDPSRVTGVTRPGDQPMSNTGAVLARLKGGAGGLVGGGLGGLAGTAAGIALAPETGGLSLALPLLGGIGGGLAGGTLGEKAQESILSPDTEAQLQQEAAKAQEQHPITSAITDVTAGALASGGKFSPNAIGRAVGGDTQAIKNIALQAGLLPAINSGISLAQTGQMPSLSQLGEQVVGGALFSEPSALGRIPGRLSSEPSPEALAKDNTPTTPSTPTVADPYSGISDENMLAAWKKAFPKPEAPEDAMNNPEYWKQKTQWDALQRSPLANKRQMMVDKWSKQNLEANPEPTVKIPGTATTPPDEVVNPPTVSTTGDTTSSSVSDLGNERDKLQEDATNKANEQAQPFAEHEGSNKPTETPIGEQTQQTIGQKPLNENAMRIINPQTLLQSNVGRPEITQVSGKDITSPELQRMDNETLQQEFLKSQEELGQLLAQKGKGVYGNDQPQFGQKNIIQQSQLKDAASKTQLIGQELQRRQQQLQQRHVDTRSDAERIQDEMEGTGAKFSQPTIGRQFGKDSMPPVVEDHIMHDPNATTGSVMRMMSESQGHPMQSLAKWLYENMDSQSRKVPWSSTFRNRSRYNPPALGDNVQMAALQVAHAPTVMEEAIHSMTSAKLPGEWEGLRGAELKSAMDKFVSSNPGHPISELVKAYYDTANALGIHDTLFSNKPEHLKQYIGKGNVDITPAYGVAGDPDYVKKTGAPYAMGDLHEFIAHAFSDRDFQVKSNGIKAGDGTNRTMWQRLVDAIRHLLGMPVEHVTMLDHVLRQSAELIRQPRGESNAIQKQSSSSILPHSSEAIGKAGGEREGMGRSDEREEAPSKSHQTSSGKEQRDVVVNTKHLGKVGNITRSLIDKIRDINHPAAQHVADAIHNVFNDRQANIGQWVNKPLQSAEGLSQHDKQVIGRQMEANRQNGNYGTELLENGRQKQYYNEALKANQAIFNRRIADQEPVSQGGFPRETKQIPGYWPTMPKQAVIQKVREGVDQEAIGKIQKDFEENRQKYGETPEEAADAWKDFVTSVQGNTRNLDVSNQQFFNAARRSHGVPLPESLRENDPVLNFERYGRRSAMDSAHYKYVESDHKVLSALGERKDAWHRPVTPMEGSTLGGNTTVRDALRTIHGEIGSPGEFNERATSTLATTTFVAGLPLEAHKIISNVIPGLAADSDNPFQYVRALGYGLTHLKAGYQHAVEGGLTKMTARSFLDMFSGTATAAERMQALAKGIRNVASLGDLTNKWGTAILQSAEEVIVPSKIQRANAGNKDAQQWLKNLYPNYKVGKVYSEGEIRQLSSIAASYIHGTGDARTLPGWMLNDSEFSGFFALAHWSTAQTNRFYSNVLTPASHGNIGPLMNTVFGAAIGGYMVKKIREELQGKKNQIPSLEEIANSDRGLEGNMGLLGYNLVAAAQYSGFGGLLAQVAKVPFDVIYKNNSGGTTFPLDEVVEDLGTTLHDASTSIANDPNVNWLHLAEAVSMHILTQSVQMGRMSYNQGIDKGLITGLPAEKKALSDKMNQLRRFDMVTGLPYNEIDEASNPYTNLEQKRFKAEQDIPTAMKELPGLVQGIMQAYHNNPDVMMSKLKALKQNSYSTFPSLEDTPLSFGKYLAYLTRTEGPEKAQQELMDYQRHKIVNEVKGSVVP